MAFNMPMRRLPPDYRELIALSEPIAGIQFAQIALTSTDLMMMGLIGVDALTALGLALFARDALTVCAVPMLAISVVYLLLPRFVLWPFLATEANPAIVATATTLLWFAIAYQFFAAAQNIYIGLLRGLGNTKSSLTNTLIGYWLIGIPAILLFGQWLDWRGAGVWLGLCIAFAATSLLLWRRFTIDLHRLVQRGKADI